jgi:hypothetical protein
MLPKTFSVAQANALVPWLMETFASSKRLTKAVRTLELELAAGQRSRGMELGGSVVHSEPDPILVKSLAELKDELRERLEGPLALGIAVRRVDGLVDFPAWREGRIIYLCWKFGEREVAFWHPIEAGVEGRRALFGDKAVHPAAELN